MRLRPLAVTIIGCVYILTGAITGAFHFMHAWAQRPLSSDLIWIELVAAAAIVAGGFLLRGRDWARWLALAWMAFHVVLSIFHSPGELAIHSLFFAILAYFLLRASASRFFRPERV